MEKHDNFLVNFSLKGFTSILVGIYILIGAYSTQFILDGFLIDESPMGMMSTEIIEVLIIATVGLVFVFSFFALFFKGRREAKNFDYKLWNGKTKTAFWKCLLSLITVFYLLIVLKNVGYINYITPVVLVLYGALLVILKNTERKKILVLSGICVLLAILCLLIPSYWHSSFCIVGLAHITYGVVVRN
jgi:membrane-associated HD superfamily phosphohydrolase